ncbi:hypothetical protein HU200_002171 [Digitaria exilis]|uniref:Uncharacterized protein n=1 Tax=Digitaria exilis TaxID=1010633 RepID=A0A835KU85_9POAL|nr:hypothetical protein HU200_002171 [Digitaria exilis]
MALVILPPAYTLQSCTVGGWSTSTPRPSLTLPPYINHPKSMTRYTVSLLPPHHILPCTRSDSAHQLTVEEEETAHEREQKRARRRSGDRAAMACINMYNPDGAAGFGGGPQPPAAALGPRISFSSDFAVEPPPPVQNRAMSLRCQEEDLNFEFSVGSHPMMAADQLFSKGRILPLKDNGGCFAGRPPTTLRDELRGGDDDERASASKGSTSSRWKEMLGLRKALCVGGGIGGGAAKKGSSSDKGVVADADMVVVADMAASNQLRLIWSTPCLITDLFFLHAAAGAMMRQGMGA